MRSDMIRASVRRAHVTLSQPVSALSLAAFRIALGALLVWDCWRFVKYDRVWRYWVAPEIHFTYEGFGWITPLPEPWIHLAWLLVGGSAFCVMLGLFYRISIVVLTVTFGYFFLLDKAEYLNHFYLVLLFLLLMCVLPAHRAFSLDARLFRRSTASGVPYAAVFVLRAQMEIVLVFAGLVKLTSDWLAGQPLGLWLRAQADSHPLGALFVHDWLILAGTWGTVALHLVGAPLLLWRRTRLAAFCVYALFHAANAGLFNIGIFPWLTFAATTIFFAPDWPHRLARWCLGWFETLPAPADTLGRTTRRLPRVTLLAMSAWIAVQIALPLRSLAFASEVRWAGDGHRFSWRMRIYDRQADGRFIVTADGQHWYIDPETYLSPRQARKMMVRADMVHHFAGELAERWQEAGYSDVSVRAEIRKSLNGRPLQNFIDPAIDLTSVEVARFSSDSWIVPLQSSAASLSEPQ
ncbi:hypothetical protein OCH239_12300 [Roseivivax halodurans JCM 10272]|uniref:HTTM-like domain-containing protein n=1 Tax=Roseivivax halodurans JCM 10272 TaxID=1449350 RepID=X7EBE3_9RHOB|nr:HTTM domain-containing protein [Roseivivax halodurans]ETX13282.1 hypothetical protein OCH239_12300 [Roseivivax halodurans JCM 10272]